MNKNINQNNSSKDEMLNYDLISRINTNKFIMIYEQDKKQGDKI